MGVAIDGINDGGENMRLAKERWAIADAVVQGSAE